VAPRQPVVGNSTITSTTAHATQAVHAPHRGTPPDVAAYHSRLPRLTNRVMLDLRLWMGAFGVLIGVAFPYVCVFLGVPSSIALQPDFFASTLVAGIVVAEVNRALAQAVVGIRVRALAAGMQRVETALVDATYTGDWAACDPASCKVPVDSVDELGDVAMSYNRLVESLAASHEVADGIAAVGAALSANLDMGALAESTLRELVARTNSSAAALLVVSNGAVSLAGSIGIRDAEILAASEAVRSVLRTERPTILRLPPDVLVSGAVMDVVPQEVQVLPITYGVLTVGVLVVTFTVPCTAQAEAVLTSSMPSLAVALRNALNHQDLQRVAALDPLTSVYNRRFGAQRLKEEFGRALRSGDPLGLLMIDIDHFKAVNDTYGHLVGDRVLQSMVLAARQVLREGDVLIRFGGEEFLVLLPGAGREDLNRMAERIRRAAADADVTDGGQRINVTISIGGAGLPDQHVVSPEELISIADTALYTAKTSGRDRSVIA
jgi:two-component system cell cycle response regulator